MREREREMERERWRERENENEGSGERLEDIYKIIQHNSLKLKPFSYIVLDRNVRSMILLESYLLENN